MPFGTKKTRMMWLYQSVSQSVERLTDHGS